MSSNRQKNNWPRAKLADNLHKTDPLCYHIHAELATNHIRVCNSICCRVRTPVYTFRRDGLLYERRSTDTNILHANSTSNVRNLDRLNDIWRDCDRYSNRVDCDSTSDNSELVIRRYDKLKKNVSRSFGKFKFDDIQPHVRGYGGVTKHSKGGIGECRRHSRKRDSIHRTNIYLSDVTESNVINYTTNCYIHYLSKNRRNLNADYLREQRTISRLNCQKKNKTELKYSASNESSTTVSTDNYVDRNVNTCYIRKSKSDKDSEIPIYVFPTFDEKPNKYRPSRHIGKSSGKSSATQLRILRNVHNGLLGIDPNCNISMAERLQDGHGVTPDSGMDSDPDNPVYITWVKWKGHGAKQSPPETEALFGGQLAGRQYSGVKINPIFLECNTNDDTSTLGLSDKDTRFQKTEARNIEQHDSGISSDISSGDSHVGAETSPIIRKVERNDTGDIVLTLNNKPNTVQESGLGPAQRQRSLSSNSFGFQKDFGTDTRMVVNGNSISFIKDVVVNGRDTDDQTKLNQTPDGINLSNQNDQPTTMRTSTTFSYENNAYDAESEDHYQTIDAVILPDPEDIANSKYDNNDSKSDNSDDIAQLYVQVRKGKVCDVSEPVMPLYRSTVLVDRHEETNSAGSSISQEEYETGTITLKPGYQTGTKFDNKHEATRSFSNINIESSRRPTLVRAYSDGNADDLELPDYWNPHKIGKRRKKHRLCSTKSASYIESSPGKELKSILVSAGTNSRVSDDSTLKSMTGRDEPLPSHSSLSEQKSVKFSDDTVDNEHKAKQYRQEVLDLCELHRHQYMNQCAHTPVLIEEVPYDGGFSWPAQPMENFNFTNSYINNNFHYDSGMSETTRRVCPKCRLMYQGSHPGKMANQMDPACYLPGHLNTIHNVLPGNATRETVHGHPETGCYHNHHMSPRVECQNCIADRRKLHLSRRRRIMRWSLLVFILVLIMVGSAVGIGIHFGIKS